ncbi:MAG: flagellar protein [Lachnospiraceae bacterium]|jgi:flagellar operon protein|nr:flagellar protein [Lachnospiraceae bacterium]
MNRVNHPFTSIEQVADQYFVQKQPGSSKGAAKTSFDEILKQKQGLVGATELKFSKHASMRLENRNISLTDEQNNRLESGVQKASEKGINESLVIVDSLAFIVNIPNKTVVTAMDQKEATDNIFTNIDGAVII